MRIAIVGGGISGLAAAWALRRDHALRLFERELRPGGHARTVMVGGVPVDTGFLVYNETTYPGFSAFLRELGAPTQPGEMSFSVRCRAHGVEWSSHGLRGFLARPRNAARPSHWRMLWGMRRFYRDARAVLDGAPDGDALTLGDYLRRHGRGSTFAGHYLRPLAAAVWSSPARDIGRMPFGYFVRFLANHGMIGWGRRPQWRTVTGGSQAYVAAVRDALGGALRADAPVARVCRDDGGVTVALRSGEAERFDAVILACHADDALALLEQPSEAEASALGAIRYTRNRVVLHTDPAVLPRRDAARASWNYTTTDCRVPGPQLSLTYDLNRLQRLPGPATYAVTVNPDGLIDPGRVVETFEDKHPLYSHDTLRAQAAIRDLNGAHGTYYAGAYLGYGFHEDGYQAGREAARLLGAAS